MKEVKRDRQILQSLVESYGKKDILNFINSINEQETVSLKAKYRNPSLRAINEAASATSVIADALVSVAKRHDNKLDISKSGFPTTFNELCREVKNNMRNAPEVVLKSLDGRLRSIVSISAFNEFVRTPEVNDILAAAGVGIDKMNNEFRDAERQRRREERGAVAQRIFEENFNIIDLSENYTWKDIPGETGIIATIANDLVEKFPLLAEPDYEDLLYDSLIWVVRTNYEEDPVFVIVANDDYVESCINGDIVPATISKNIVDVKCIYANSVHKSVDGEPAYFAARPCTYGHFIKFPKPNNEENINAECDTDEEM